MVKATELVYLGPNFTENLKLGLGLYDIGGTDVEYENKISETILRQAVRLGIAYMPLNNLTIAMILEIVTILVLNFQF